MSNILKGISDPKDVRKLSKEEKLQLCEEIRGMIIETVSANGGHLASNLGTVELTVALLSVFDLPKDSIVWDVGHQTYAHKILTGRKEEFSTIRTKGGLSGFPSINESDCDPFTTGHSSTSISSAFGIARGGELLGENSYAVAVIGDGALTGGLAFEGLNNAGRSKKNFIVILNDNEMSISPNVGGLAKYLGYLRIKPSYIKAKSNVEQFMRKIPLIGEPMISNTSEFKNRLKKYIYKSTIFEDLGFAYYGPFDGHDIERMEETLTNAKAHNRPVLIHVKTTKGKGYDYAEANPSDFHGVGKFDAKTGQLTTAKESFSSVFGRRITKLADENSKICCITAAMAEGTGLIDFSKKHEKRFFDVGIAEAHGVTFAAGLAKKGLIPVFAVYSTFLQRAYDSLIHDIALQDLKVIMAIDRAGVVGEDGRTHHGVFDVAYLKTVPNVTIFSPTYFEDVEISLERSLEEAGSLVAVRYPRGGEMYKPESFVSSREDYQVLGNENSKITIASYGRVVSNVLKASENIGKEIKVVKLNKIFPIPKGALEECKDSTHVLFVEEGVKSGGIGESFMTELFENGFTGRGKIRAIENGFVTHSPMDDILKNIKMDEESIIKTMNEFTAN